MVPRIRSTQNGSPKMHTATTGTYLIYRNNSNVLHCITGEVIGTRPSVPLVHFSKLQYLKESEDTKNRRVIFKQIFDERIWEGNKEELRKAVHLQASGNYFIFVVQ